MEAVLLVKFAVAIIIVLTLSAVAEHVSPRAAGLLAGYPAGAAITLFFFGADISPEFAADSAIYTMMGLIATQVFVYCYFKSTLYFKKFRVAASSVFAIIGYLIAICLLHPIKLNKFLAAMLPVASIFVFIYLFRQIKNVTIQERIKLTPGVLFLRAFLAGFILLIIIATAKLVGYRWAGLFSAFPSTLYPLLLIVHLTYDQAHVHTIIKNFPQGMGSLISYLLCVSIVYPLSGIYIGTAISLAAASVYLLLYRLVIVKTR